MKNENYLDLDFTDIKSPFEMERREFIKLVGGGLFVLFTFRDSFAYIQQQQRRRQDLPTDFNAFLKIGEDGRVACYTGKIEMGQGIITSLAQELADELEIDVDSVDMVMGDTDLCPWDMGTFGSMTTRIFSPALRAAAAEAKNVLLQLASEKMNKPVNQLTVNKGTIYEKANKKNKVTFSELTKGKRIEHHLNEKVKIKDPSEFKLINKPLTRKDGYAKVTGKAKYASDILFPDMLYAKILRPPAHGAKLIDADLGDVKKMEDVVVVHEGELIAVLHKYPDVAEKALEKIKAKFSESDSKLNDNNIFEHLVKVGGKGQIINQTGNLKDGEDESKIIVEETYLDGYKAHSPMEPHSAVAKFEGKRITVWASTQNPFTLKEEVARALKMEPENVRVISPFIGGGFGGKTTNLQAIDAARLTKITGKPVMVAYTREEEFFYDSFRPAAVVKIKSGLSENKKINFWNYQVYFAGDRGAQHFYDIKNSSTISYGSGFSTIQGTHPFATGAWRAPGNNTNTFARESQIDIMASKAGIDPVKFRLDNLKDEKMIEVLTTAAKKFGWKPDKTPSGRGFGVALGSDAGTYVGIILEIEISKIDYRVQVKRAVCVQNMGLVINPEGAKIQMEGCITMGLGYALREEIHFSNGKILDKNYDTYEIPHFSWLPKIETIILDKKNEPPQGGGEPAIILMGAAIGNAIYDATGVRLTQMPFTSDRIKETILKKGADKIN